MIITDAIMIEIRLKELYRHKGLQIFSNTLTEILWIGTTRKQQRYPGPH